MLNFLVTSKARRRLLLLFFGEKEKGTATYFARAAGVGFASAYRELKAMKTLGLLVSTREKNLEVYQANRSHPAAALLTGLVATETQRMPAAPEDQQTRGKLRSLGAPLTTAPLTVPRDEVESTLVEGVALSHRAPTVARCLPLCFWKQRDVLDPDKLVTLAKAAGERQSVGFFLDLTSDLSSDRRFKKWSTALVDRRVRALSDFFTAQPRAMRPIALKRIPSAARRWGFSMNADFDWFEGLFMEFAE